MSISTPNLSVVLNAAAACVESYYPSHEAPSSRGLVAGPSYMVPLQRNVLGSRGTCRVVTWVCPVNHTLYVSFAGSVDLEHWLYNLSWSTVPFENLSVHEGFVSLTMEVAQYFLSAGMLCPFDELRSLVDRRGIREIVFSGHSAGGALANLLPVFWDSISTTLSDISWRVVDFGTPRFISYPNKNQTWGPLIRRDRFQFTRDIVPHAPPALAPLPGATFHHWGNSWLLYPAPPASSPLMSCPTSPCSLLREVWEHLAAVIHYTGMGLTAKLPIAILVNHRMLNYYSLLQRIN